MLVLQIENINVLHLPTSNVFIYLLGLFKHKLNQKLIPTLSEVTLIWVQMPQKKGCSLALLLFYFTIWLKERQHNYHFM